MFGSKFFCVFITYLAAVLCADPFVILITDGTRAKHKEFPSIVSIQEKHNQKCGGSLITWNHILTATHCLVNAIPRTNIYTILDTVDFKIIAGDIRIKGTSFSRQTRIPTEFFTHPDYVPRTMANDVGVIRVHPKFMETPYVKLITLSKSTPEIKTVCIISGWGAFREQYSHCLPNILRKTDVEIKSWQVCNSSTSYKGRVPNLTICAGSIGIENPEAKHKGDSCQGDSGGPLICGERLTGVISFGDGCGTVRYPGIYTDVSKFLSWIEYVISRSHAIVKRCSGINLIIQLVILYKM